MEKTMGLPLLKAKHQATADGYQLTDHIPHECGSIALDANQFDGIQNFEAMCIRLGSGDLNTFFSLLDN